MTLGVKFFKPKELVDSLFLQMDKGLVDVLGERPVVGFVTEGSSDRSEGVELGHVLVKVNGIDVKNPMEASRLIKEGPRPLPLLFYVPDNPTSTSISDALIGEVTTQECQCCFSEHDYEDMVSCRFGGHLFCKTCLQRHTEERVFGVGSFGVMPNAVTNAIDVTNGTRHRQPTLKALEIMCTGRTGLHVRFSRGTAALGVI